MYEREEKHVSNSMIRAYLRTEKAGNVGIGLTNSKYMNTLTICYNLGQSLVSLGA
jgi:hypothetical protein